MALFVDYENWKGRRAWREIEPDGACFVIQRELAKTKNEPAKEEWTLNVRMVDKDGDRRTLLLRNIHGFEERKTSPMPSVKEIWMFGLNVRELSDDEKLLLLERERLTGKIYTTGMTSSAADEERRVQIDSYFCSKRR